MQEMTTCGDVTHNDVSHTVSTLFHTLVFIFFHSDRNTNYLCLAINLVPELEDCRLNSKCPLSRLLLCRWSQLFHCKAGAVASLNFPHLPVGQEHLYQSLTVLPKVEVCMCY